jgi:hypothetical protein
MSGEDLGTKSDGFERRSFSNSNFFEILVYFTIFAFPF